MWVQDGIVDLLVVALLAISIPVIIIVGIAIRVCVKRGVHADIIAPFACFMFIAALAAIIGWHFFLFGVGIYGEAYVLFYLGWIVAVIAGSVLLTSLVARRFGRLVSPPSEPSESGSESA